MEETVLQDAAAQIQGIEGRMQDAADALSSGAETASTPDLSDALSQYEMLAGKTSSLAPRGDGGGGGLASLFGGGGAAVKSGGNDDAGAAIAERAKGVGRAAQEGISAFMQNANGGGEGAPGEGASIRLPRELPELKAELPELPELPDLPKLPELPELPELPDLSGIRASVMDRVSGVLGAAPSSEAVQSFVNALGASTSGRAEDAYASFLGWEQSVVSQIVEAVEGVTPTELQPALQWAADHPTTAVAAPVALAISSSFVSSISSSFGYSGELSPDATLKMLLEGGTGLSALLIDLRGEDEVISAGIPSLRLASRGKALRVPFSVGSVGRSKNSFSNRRAVEAASVAAIVAGLKGVSRGTKLIFMDRRGGNGDARLVARAMRSAGFAGSFVVRGGFDAFRKSDNPTVRGEEYDPLGVNPVNLLSDTLEDSVASLKEAPLVSAAVPVAAVAGLLLVFTSWRTLLEYVAVIGISKSVFDYIAAGDSDAKSSPAASRSSSPSSSSFSSDAGNVEFNRELLLERGLSTIRKTAVGIDGAITAAKEKNEELKRSMAVDNSTGSEQVADPTPSSTVEEGTV